MQKRFTINVAHLRVLHELRERGTITAAASTLHLTPSAVSQQLRTLSRALGVPLTERSGRLVRLTPQAALVLKHAESIGAQLERVQAELAAFEEGQAGTVTIASFASAIQPLLVPALHRLAKERPQLEVAIHELEPPIAFASLDSGTIDILVTVDYVEGPTHSDPRYHRTDLIRDPLVAVLPLEHPRAGARGKVNVRDLAREQWVLGTPGHPCVDVTIAAQSTAGFTATVAHRANDWAAAAALVATGHGVALIPELAIRNIRASGLAIRPITPPIARNIYAAVRTGSERAPHISAALAALRSEAARIQTADSEATRRASPDSTCARPTKVHHP